MTISDGIERREFKRVKYTELIIFQEWGKGEIRHSLAKDFCEGGLRLVMNEFYPVHTRLKLQLKLASGRVLTCLGSVKWISDLSPQDQYLAGVKFIRDLSEE